MKITNHEARVHFIGDDITLNPGENEVDDKAWEAAKKIKVVGIMLEKGILSEPKSSKK